MGCDKEIFRQHCKKGRKHTGNDGKRPNGQSDDRNGRGIALAVWSKGTKMRKNRARTTHSGVPPWAVTRKSSGSIAKRDENKQEMMENDPTASPMTGTAVGLPCQFGQKGRKADKASQKRPIGHRQCLFSWKTDCLRSPAVMRVLRIPVRW